MNTTASWGAGTAIANGGTATYRVPLPMLWFQQSEAWLQSHKGDILIRVVLRPSSDTVTAGSTTSVIITSATLIVEDESFIDGSYQERQEEIHGKIPCDNLFTDFKCQQFPSLSYTQGTSQTHVLTGITGPVNFIFFFVRSSPVNASNINTFSAITSFEIQDPNGKNIIGGSAILSADWLSMIAPSYLPSQLTLNKNIYGYFFCDSPMKTIESGSNTGFYTFTGKERLVITAASTATVQVDVFAYCTANARVLPNGMITLYK